MANWLATLAGRLEPLAARRLCEPPAVAFADNIVSETDAELCQTFAESLAALAGCLEPQAAARICEPPAEKLAAAIASGHHGPEDYEYLAGGLSALAKPLEPDSAHRLCERSARRLSDIIIANDSVLMDMQALSRGLAKLVERMEPKQAIEILSAPLEAESLDWHDRGELLQAIAREAVRLDVAAARDACDPPAWYLACSYTEARKFASLKYIFTPLDQLARRLDPVRAVEVLTTPLEQENLPSEDRRRLIEALSREAGRLEPAEARRICEPLARAAIDDFAFETDPDKLRLLAASLAALALRLEGSAILDELDGVVKALDRKRSLLSSKSNGWYILTHGAIALNRSVGNMSDARTLAFSIVSELHSRVIQLPVFGEFLRPEDLLDAVLSEVESGPTANPPSEKGPNPKDDPKAPSPDRCRLPTSDLVELLKMPTCFGPTRRVVLDHLGRRYGRHFANHWEFVEYARSAGLDLDFTTPPTRPTGFAPPPPPPPAPAPRR